MAREPALAAAEIQHPESADLTAGGQQSRSMHLVAVVVQARSDEVVPGTGRLIPGLADVFE